MTKSCFKIYILKYNIKTTFGIEIKF